MSEIWQIITQSPQDFRGGAIWSVVASIHGALQAMCVLGAAPFAALGFFTYHGMTAEQFLWVWLRSELLELKELHFKSSTLYYDILKSSMEKREREECNQNFLFHYLLHYGILPL